MGALSAAILNVLGLNIISGRKNTAANVRAVVGTIADAVAALEGLQRGASILSGAGAPANATGNDGDAYINTTVSDLYLKASGTWALRLVLRGNDGASAYQSWLKVGNVGSELAFVLSLRGQDGLSAYQSWQAAGNVGSEVQFVASLAGRSAYQSWQAAGNVGTEAQFVASLQAKQGDPGERGNRITANATAPNSGGVLGEAGDLEVIGAGTTFTDRIPGDLHYQTLSADRFRLWYQDRGAWVALYTTPAGATVADGSITNAKLDTDVKVGSLAAARIAFPSADRVNLNSFTDMVAWCASGITNMIQGLAALTTRVKTLEDRPTTVTTTGGGTSSGSGGGHTIQDKGQSLAQRAVLNFTGPNVSVTDDAGNGATKVTIRNTAFVDMIDYLNFTEYTRNYFEALSFTQITRSAGLATVEYKINTGSFTALAFTNNVSELINAPIAIAAGDEVTWRISYGANVNRGSVQFKGTLTA